MSWRKKLQAGLADLAAWTEDEAPSVATSFDAINTAMPPAKVRTGRRAAPYRAADGIVGSELSHKLETLTHSALDRAQDILDIPLDPDDERYPDNLRGLNAAIKTVVTTQVKVDEHRLKQRKLDVLPDLLKEIAEQEKKLALVASA